MLTRALSEANIALLETRCIHGWPRIVTPLASQGEEKRLHDRNESLEGGALLSEEWGLLSRQIHQERGMWGHAHAIPLFNPDGCGNSRLSPPRQQAQERQGRAPLRDDRGTNPRQAPEEAGPG